MMFRKVVVKLSQYSLTFSNNWLDWRAQMFGNELWNNVGGIFTSLLHLVIETSSGELFIRHIFFFCFKSPMFKFIFSQIWELWGIYLKHLFFKHMRPTKEGSSRKAANWLERLETPLRFCVDWVKGATKQKHHFWFPICLWKRED